MEPLPPTESPHRRDMPPSLLGPSPRSASPVAADDGADVSEHPCVTLEEWWLASVEGDDQKVAVAGTFEWKQAIQELSPAPIAKRHEPFLLECEDGTILRLQGGNNVARTFRNGYSTTVCEKFLDGFPDWWQSCKLRYPKLTTSHTAPNASTSGVDSTEFYLEQFELGKRLDSAATYLITKVHGPLESFSCNDVFQKSSHLFNGAPRFEEYTCDGDIASNENATASSEAAKGDQRSPVSLEICGYRKETQHKSVAEKAVVDKETPSSNKKAHWSPRTRGKATSLSMSTPEDLKLKRTRSGRVIVPRLDEGCQHIFYGCDGSIAGVVGLDSPAMPKLSKSKTDQRKTRWRKRRTRCPEAHWSPRTRGKATSLSTPEDLKLKRTRSGRVIVPRLDEGCQHIFYGCDGSIAGVIGLDSTAMPKLSERKTGRRKKRRTECASSSFHRQA